MTASPAAWRTIIVDDEPLAREGIRARLVTLGGFDVVDECGNSRDAIVAIRSRQPDVVFLDVQMPIADGFAVISEIGAEAMPATVFVTAHDHYALRAFDAQAIDYVLKPIDDGRFARTVENVRRRLREARQNVVAQQLAALLDRLERAPSAEEPPARGGHLVARDGSRTELIPFDEIDYVIADGDYVRLFAGKRQLLLRLTMNRIEAALPPHAHVRIHRSAIVNVSRVRTLETLPNAELLVVLRNGTTLRASRSYAARLRLTLGVISAGGAVERMK
jgi:two-component system, LytTR family, response regulator